MDFGAKVALGALILSFIFQDTGWIISFALLEVANAIREKRKVE